MDTHKDNSKHKMQDWAVMQCIHVMIDRDLSFPNSTMQVILSLWFNLGGTTAKLSSADSGITILICCTWSFETKATLKMVSIVVAA
jgi:hypothetical protein